MHVDSCTKVHLYSTMCTVTTIIPLHCVIKKFISDCAFFLQYPNTYVVFSVSIYIYIFTISDIGHRTRAKMSNGSDSTNTTQHVHDVLVHPNQNPDFRSKSLVFKLSEEDTKNPRMRSRVMKFIETKGVTHYRFFESGFVFLFRSNKWIRLRKCMDTLQRRLVCKRVPRRYLVSRHLLRKQDCTSRIVISSGDIGEELRIDQMSFYHHKHPGCPACTCDRKQPTNQSIEIE